MKSATTLRMPTGPSPRWFMAAGLLLVLALAGCGTAGPAGAAGSSASTATVESGITQGTTLTAADTAPGISCTISSVTGGTGAGGTFRAGDVPVVTFQLTKNDGSAWHLGEMALGSIFISGPCNNYQRVIPEQTDLRTRAVANGNGSYTYTFAQPLTTFSAPLNDKGNYGVADGVLTGALTGGTYTVGLSVTWNYTIDSKRYTDSGCATKDFTFGNSAMPAHEVVKDDNCNTCHVKIQHHEGAFQGTKMCVLCHTAGAEDRNDLPGGVAGTRIEFKMMIHRIHNGAHLPKVNGVSRSSTGARVYGTSPSSTAVDVYIDGDGNPSYYATNQFPLWPSFNNLSMPRHKGYSALSTTNKSKEDVILRGVVACYKCHGDPDGTGPLIAPTQGANCYTVPSRAACGSCHDDWDPNLPFTENGMTMPALANDNTCTNCHDGTGTTKTSGIAVAGGTVRSTPFAHVHPLADPTRITGVTEYSAPANNPGLSTTISDIKFTITSVTGTSSQAYFQNGDKPTINFTVTDNAGTLVPLYRFNSATTILTGPTNNRQVVFPLAGPNSISYSTIDSAGRTVGTYRNNNGAVGFTGSQNTGNGTMSRVVGSTASETLKVQFSSSTAFAVTSLSSTGSVLTRTSASATLAASVSSNPGGSSISAIELTNAAVAQQVSVYFTSSTAFTATGSVSGVLGSWSLPTATNASTRVTSTDGSIAFQISTSTTAAAANNAFILTVVRTSVNNHCFAIVAGSTAFAANDRFYYDTIDNSATSYSYHIPMDFILEKVGNRDLVNSAGQSCTVANAPIYWGREAVLERTATGAPTYCDSTLAAAAATMARYVDVTTSGTTNKLAVGSFVVLDSDQSGLEEYLLIGYLSIPPSGSGTRAWFTTPLRYGHALNSTIKGVKLQQLKESVDYTVKPSTGEIVLSATATGGDAILVNYRTDGAFGWRRHFGDSLQTVYPATVNDSPDFGQSWGKWQGLAFKNGTYTAAIYGSLPLYVSDAWEQGEVQTYSLAAQRSAGGDFRYGSGGATTAYNLISSPSNCDQCHDRILFHGGSRKGTDTCMMCHAIAGIEDKPRYNNGVADTTGVTVNFREMLHKIHMGEELDNPSNYQVVGNSSASNYAEVVFPALPGKAKVCEKCHGTGSTTWKAPSSRDYSTTITTRNWKIVCNSCHNSTDAGNHMDAMTTSGGIETCTTCHAAGQLLGVDTVHQNRAKAP